jgi:SAM-dependent methyltransferase
MRRQHGVSAALRGGGRVSDALFDHVYPLSVQRASSRFWTPVGAGVTAAGWLNALGCESVLDIGAGAGKFCIVTSLVLDRTMTGVEQRPRLVEAARSAAAEYAADVEFVEGTLDAVDPRIFDAFYLYNPFAENVYEEESQLDGDVELSRARWLRDLGRVEHWLDDAPQSTHVLTYNGFGGRIPASYRLRRSLLVDGNWLRLWTKRHSGSADGFFIEVDDLVISNLEVEALEERVRDDSLALVQALLERPPR